MPRKFEIGDAVVWPSHSGGLDRGVVVAYIYEPHIGRGRGKYVMLRRYGHQRLYGETATRLSQEVQPDVGAPPNRKAVSIVRNNSVIVDRGCSCNCCIHTAMRASDVNDDGTFAWEKGEEDED